MDGPDHGNANRDQTKEVLGVSLGGSDESSRRSRITEENMLCSVLQVRVRRTSNCGPERS